jgi:putrescine aminotransferase
MRAVGDTIVVAPPLVLSFGEADELIEKAWKCLDLTLAALSAARQSELGDDHLKCR